MSGKKLENIQMGRTWTSYISSVEGALRSAGLWDGETWKLMGMSGIGFHFIIHKKVCASSVTVYDWAGDHIAAMDRIGIYSEIVCNMDTHMNTFTKAREDAVRKIKESILSGRPVVVWAPTPILEFGLITGFDDDDGVFHVMDCTCRPVDPLLYENLGMSEVPILFYQIFKEKVDVNREKIFRDSLSYGVSEWEKIVHCSPEYASGRKAYEFLIKAMEEGEIDDFGLAYSLAVYVDAKECIAKYLNYINETSEQLRGINKAAELFTQIADKYKQLTALFPFSGCNGSGCTIDRGNIPEGLNIIRECFALEEDAFRCIKSVLKG